MKTNLCLLPFLLCALMSQPTVLAENEVAKDASKVTGTYHFLIYMNGANVGYKTITRSDVTLDGKQAKLEHGYTYVEIQRSHDGQKFVITEDASEWSETSGAPIKSVTLSTSGPQVTTLTVKWSEKTIEITKTIDDGKPGNWTLKREPEDLLTPDQALRKLKADKRLKKGEKFAFHMLDAEKHAIVPVTWTMAGTVEKKLRSGDKVKGTQFVEVKSGTRTTAIFDDERVPLFFDAQGMVQYERTDRIPDNFKAEKAEIQNVYRTNVAVEDFFQLKSMEIHFGFKHDDGDGVPLIADSNGYHDVIKYKRGGRAGYALRLKSQKLAQSFKAPAYPLTEIPAEVAKYVKATPLCQADDAELMFEAGKLKKGAKDSRRVATSICRWVYRYLGKESGKTAQASAKAAYLEKKGDCTEHAALFVAVARAAGLPARNAGGLVYIAGNGQGLFGFHAWAEVWLGKWVPVDPTVNKVGIAARYVLFEYDEPGETHGAGRTLRVISQKIKPRVDYYQMANRRTWQAPGVKRFDFEKKPKEGTDG